MIGPRFTPEQFAQSIRQKVDRIEEKIFERMQIAGEEAVNYARNLNTYKDQTGNLRSSIGYVIYKDGRKIYQSSFEKVKDGDEGRLRGPELANKVAGDISGKGYALVVVAGMKYAFYVETRGRDVLTGSEIRTKIRLDRALKRIKSNLR